ncbi:MAG: J domain-containing protein [Desulfomonilaceae bacterium]|nr:J domain-containing protein [Desulfomonilaceae bacterium]
MITLLSIIVPVVVFLLALWTIAIIQKHWFGTEHTESPHTGEPHGGGGTGPFTCRECGASGPDVIFINRLCLTCHEKQWRREQPEGYDVEQDETSGEMARYYRILGCSEQDSDQELKRQYHRRAKEVHPDSLQGPDLSDDLIRRRTAEFQKLQEAYGKILERRARDG